MLLLLPLLLAVTAHVTLKDYFPQVSSPLRHVAEFVPVLEEKGRNYIASLFMFVDGGSDHTCKHLSVHTSLLALLLLGGMDAMVRPAEYGYFCTIPYIGDLGLEIWEVGDLGIWDNVGMANAGIEA